LHRRLRQADGGHLGEQFGASVEAVADGTGQGGQPFGGRREAAGGNAGGFIEGEEALAAAAAVVVGAAAADRPAQAGQGVFAVAVVGGGLLAAGAGY
jgi:hypothetical protein